jgi:hypothetical protein
MTAARSSPQRAQRMARRWYLVARGAACLYCIAHGWRAFRDPEDKDVMSPCTLDPIYRVQARNKREAVATVVSRMAAEREEEKNRGGSPD